MALSLCSKLIEIVYSVVMGSEIAQGGYSFVYRATDAFTGEAFALKKILAQAEDQQAAALNEIKIHKSFDHPNIMPLTDYGIVSEGVQHLEYYLLFPMMEVRSRGHVGPSVAAGIFNHQSLC